MNVQQQLEPQSVAKITEQYVDGRRRHERASEGERNKSLETTVDNKVLREVSRMHYYRINLTRETQFRKVTYVDLFSALQGKRTGNRSKSALKTGGGRKRMEVNNRLQLGKCIVFWMAFISLVSIFLS